MQINQEPIPASHLNFERQTMTCGIDDILEKSNKSINDAINKLIQELDADFDLNLDSDTIMDSPQVRQLRGELGTFSVWLVHGLKKINAPPRTSPPTSIR